MLKKLLISSFIATLVLISGTILLAGTESPGVTIEDSNKAEDVGNKFCPVSGEEIEESSKATYEYNGKIYNFCCASCIEEFKKDPEKYIKKIEEMRAQEKNVENKQEKADTKPEMTMHMEHQHQH
jgi:YHS domain-containing protein